MKYYITKKEKEKLYATEKARITKKYANSNFSLEEKGYLLEIYLKFIETTEGTSNRRILLNYAIFLTLTIALSTLLIFEFSTNFIISIILAIGILIISFLWLLSIKSHSQLNRSKFDILKIVSNKLFDKKENISIFDEEYSLYSKLNNNKFIEISNIEKWICYSFMMISIVIIIWETIKLII